MAKASSAKKTIEDRIANVLQHLMIDILSWFLFKLDNVFRVL